MIKRNSSILNLKVISLLMASTGVVFASPKAPPLQHTGPDLQDRVNKLERKLNDLETNQLKISQQLDKLVPLMDKLMAQKGAAPVVTGPVPAPYSQEWLDQRQQERLENLQRQQRRTKQ